MIRFYGVKRFEVFSSINKNGSKPTETMIEFYMAYADYRDLVTMTEDLLGKLSLELFGSTKVLIP